MSISSLSMTHLSNKNLTYNQFCFSPFQNPYS
jgi:hypothetical protein